MTIANEPPKSELLTESELADLLNHLAGDPLHYSSSRIQEAVRHGNQVLPALRERLSEELEAFEAGQVDDAPAILPAMFFFAEFGDQSGFPLLTRAACLPTAKMERLFGDTLTEHLPQILGAIAPSAQALYGVVARKDLDPFVRLAYAQAYLEMVFDGRLTRDEAIEHLKAHLNETLEDADENDFGDQQTVTLLLCELRDCGTSRVVELVREALDRELYEYSIADFDLSDFETDLDETQWIHLTARRRQRRLRSAVDGLMYWQGVAKSNEAARVRDVQRRLEDEAELYSQPAASTVFRDDERVGRNDPCPCLSGKKFKKCCGKS